MAPRSSKAAIILCLFQSLAGFIFGWENSSTSGLFALPAYLERFGTCDTFGADGTCTNYSLPTIRTSTISGIFCIGAFMGALGSVSTSRSPQVYKADLSAGSHLLASRTEDHLPHVHLCLHGRSCHRGESPYFPCDQHSANIHSSAPPSTPGRKSSSVAGPPVSESVPPLVLCQSSRLKPLPPLTEG